jgi:hypothetical protein
MDQRAIALYLHLNELSAHAIYDDPVATTGPTVMAYSTLTHYLREARPGTAEVTLGPEPNSPHLDDCGRAVLAALGEKKSRFRSCNNLPEPPISQAPPSIEGSPNRSGSYHVFFAECRTFGQTLRR